MPDFEFEFNQQDKDLVVSQIPGVFSDNDYIRLTIYPTEAINNIVDLPDDTKGIDGQAIFFSTLADTMNINISPFKDVTGVLTEYPIGGDLNDFKIYVNEQEDGSVQYYIKPNEIFNEYELPQGNYRIQIDFLRQVKPLTGEHYDFIIKQISTSRKEVRLKLLNTNILKDSVIITNLQNELNGNTGVDGEYQFKHVLNNGTGDHIPIMNYAFDAVTDGKDNQSIILKLYEPLTGAVGNLSMVTLEREVLTTQIQDIFYFSDVEPIFFGDGLEPDSQENWINPDNNQHGFQSIDEIAISASIGDIEVDSLISSSEYGYPNLNTDFNEFENHTFFGSAKKKLENFNKKVKTIQSYYSEISSSLVVSSSIDDENGEESDSTFIIQKRKNLFNKINEEFKTFTPYENFLYFDAQTDSTASAPSLKNYAHTNPLSQSKNLEELYQHNGFNVVYKNSNLEDNKSPGITRGLYKSQDKPFFNHSGSVYLSFLLKGSSNSEIRYDNTNNLSQGYALNGFYLPYDTFYSSSILAPSVTGSEYRRFIYEASQSYFVPNTTNNDMADLQIDEGDFEQGSTKVTILSGSIKTGSFVMKDSLNVYPTTVISHSGVPFSGSVMSAGELFDIYILSGSALSQSVITDVKVTLKDPTNVLPFDNLFHTSSTEWTNLYDGMLTKAETFDTDNIHSFENNLPLYIQESSQYNDMKDFLKLQGEQYDLIRNHIDSMGTIHKRGYKKTNSPPDNTLPMLLSNMGWQAINPFTGSLTDTLGSYLSGITSIDDIKNNTWRKTLNNLLYIYKSKGTKNSVRGLLNTYGYPPDVLEFQEFNTGKNFDVDPLPAFNDNPPSSSLFRTYDTSLNSQSGSFSINSKTQKLYRYIFNGVQDRIINLDWWMNDANLNTIEFVYKHSNTTKTQTILNSSGSGTSSLWDLRLIPSSDGLSSSFEFRLNDSIISESIADNAHSMSTAYTQMSDGQLWNVMLQRMTSSTSTNIVNEYRLHTTLQEGEQITTYNYVTMSMDGVTVARDRIANVNWMATGSRASSDAGNLFVGEVFSGSLAQIKGWSTALSTSKFKQHTFNKFSTVGNTIDSYKDDLVYHFKLNENYTTSSVSASGQNLTIIDSAPKTTYSDYSFTKAGNFFTASNIYGFDYVDVIQLTTEDNINQQNNRNIFISPNRRVLGDLNPFSSAVESLTNPLGKKPKINTSPKLELYRSPQTYIDNFILDKLGGFSLETLYGNPINYYSQSYDEFITFRENFFDAHPITVDVNKFIRAHESMFNHSIVEGLKQVIPARSTFSDRNSNFGVEIKQTILEKQKYENEEHSVETNPNTTTGSVSPSPDLSTSEFVQPKSGSSNVNITTVGTYELPKSASIKISDSGSKGNPYLGNAFTSFSSSIINPHTGSLSPLPTYDGSTLVLSKDGTIDYGTIANESFKNIHSDWGTGTDDTYFINYFDTGSDGENNTYHIDDRVVFYTIGDHEYYSASNSSDFGNSDNFYNRLYLSDGIHKNVNYDSDHFATGNGIVTGRMMGKTKYFRFVTNLAGEDTITLPRNHVTKFSNPFKDRMIKGTQNITNNPSGSSSKILNVQHEDYSSASFYRVKVTGGENQIYVKGTNNPTKGSDDKIIY